MTTVPAREDLPLIGAALVTAAGAIASLHFDKNLGVAVAGVGSIATAGIGYLKARHADANAKQVAQVAADATINTNDKTVFVQSVTAERAIWRREMREATTTLVSLLRCSSEQKRIDCECVYSQCSQIRLRLNPAGRNPAPPSGDKHDLDRTIHSTLDQIVTSATSDYAKHPALADHLETAMAQLLKQEWDKSKQEAINGKLASGD
jgi:sigma54-dependent transcription regulator